MYVFVLYLVMCVCLYFFSALSLGCLFAYVFVSLVRLVLCCNFFISLFVYFGRYVSSFFIYALVRSVSFDFFIPLLSSFVSDVFHPLFISIFMYLLIAFVVYFFSSSLI